MKSIKHSKTKNIGVLFELLTRQITSDTLSNKESAAIKIIKEYFKKDTAVSRELELYRALQTQKYTSDSKADKFIDLVLIEHSKLNRKKLKQEKYNIVREIKKNYNLEDFFKSRVSNYRINATIYKLLEMHNNASIINPSLIMKHRNSIVEHVTGVNTATSKKDTLISEYSKQEKDLRLLSYKILLEKFNDKYGKLNNKQKSLLKEYIHNISNTSSLKKYLVKEVTTITKALNILNKRVKDDVVKVKLKEVVQQLGRVVNESHIKDEHIISILRSYDLVKELKNVVK